MYSELIQSQTFKAVSLGGLFALFAALFLAERRFPLRSPKVSLKVRLRTNIALALLSLLLGGILITPIALHLAQESERWSYGLLGLVEFHPLVETAIGVLLMDLSFYYWHRANHRLPLLWRFHEIHHMDPDVDVTTSLRFHYGEVLLSTAFRAVQVGVVGVSPGIYLTYEALFHATTMLQHSNLRLPIRLERAVNKVFVTPRMHGIHHSIIEAETNSNYSVVFALWDRIHGTLTLNIPQALIRTGVPAHLSGKIPSLWEILSIPFRRHEESWISPDGSRPERPEEEVEGSPVRLAA